MRSILLAATLLVAPTTLAAQDAARRNAVVNAPLPADQAALKSHVMFLASDAMRGREAGSPEYDIAAEYVAAQFYAQGLVPAGGDGGYLQPVPLVRVKPADTGGFAWTPRGGAAVPLTFGDDYLPGINAARTATVIDAPLAFVGHGIVAPTVKRDDYAGIDVRGKIVLLFGGAPASFDGEERAHFGGATTKAAIAAAKGAAGVIVIESAASAKAGGFKKDAGTYDTVRVGWGRDGRYSANVAAAVPVLGAISQAAAARIFGASWPAIAKGAGSNETRFKPRLLPGSMRASLNTQVEALPSSNVAGMIPGSDPALKDEVVVLSAHLDHIGVSKTATGDRINNGAMDNAVGIASLIEEARRFKASGKPPRRSIMFLAVTAEEKGLVGADYFAHFPSVAKERLVANVNLDMPLLTFPFQDVVVFGAERSTLGPIVRRAATGIGVTMSPDPLPDEGLFVRSDHYRFVQQGIPSVFLWPGHGGAGKEAWTTFFAKHYHKPSDEIVQEPPIDWAQGVRFVDVNYAISREIADGDARPQWNKGDFFGTLYNGFGAR